MRSIVKTVLSGMLLIPAFAFGQTIDIGGESYNYVKVIDRDLGPGVNYMRLRLPDYPLNVNILTMDMNNEYNTIETTIPGDTQFGVERLDNAAARQSREGHKVLGGANANFFVTWGYRPYGPMLVGAHVVGCVRNGQIVDETNMSSDVWNGGYTETGIFFVDKDRNLHCEAWPWFGFINSEGVDSLEINQVNKICRDNEICLYTSFFDRNKTFMPADLSEDGRQFDITTGQSTEIYLTFADNAGWQTGGEMKFTVGDVRSGGQNGNRGDYDAVVVARGEKADRLSSVKNGDSLGIRLGWSSRPGGQGIVPLIDNLVGGNALIMKDGELTSQNYNPDNMNNYNPVPYSRCAYGSSADGRKLYICVIDMSTDSIYGKSKGINTEGLCHIAKHFGCANLVNMDAGGSAQMLVGDKVINKTTEATPRAVGNGMLIYSTAPVDNVVTRIEFYDCQPTVLVNETYSPRIIAYNKYGDIVSEDYRDFKLSCEKGIGKCKGPVFTASSKPVSGNITATSGSLTAKVKLTVSVGGGDDVK